MNSELGESIHFRPARAISDKVRDLAKKEHIPQSEIMRRALDSYFGNESNIATVAIRSTLGDAEELSLFLGALHQLRQHWRDVRSRINLPRPIRPGDDEEMEQWRSQKEKIAAYFSSCEDANKRLKQLEHFFLGLTPEAYQKLQKLGELSRRAVTGYEEILAGAKDPVARENLIRNIEHFNLIVGWLQALGAVDVQ